MILEMRRWRRSLLGLILTLRARLMILVSIFTLTNWSLDKGFKKDQLRKYTQ
jgi:hypothetical protein